ncbi:MAG: hemolysin family protein, partial [Bacteroidota bacterium]
AIRKPVPVVGWSAWPLKFFYILFYPFMWGLDWITNKLLNMAGIESTGGHDSVLTEEEIRASLSIAYHQGDLTKNEHQLINAAFKFDDQVARQIMLPRREVTYFDLNNSFEQNVELAKKSKHTRFPLCVGSLDDVKGIVHIKDLIGLESEDASVLKKVARQPIFVPETIHIHALLQTFRQSKQHMALVEDEYGTIIGLVTLENVIEILVGSVQDEFDAEKPEIEKEDERQYLVSGDITINYLNDQLNINLETDKADTLSGLLMEVTGQKLEKGQAVELSEGISADIITVKNRRATKVKISLPQQSESTLDGH